MRYFAGCGCGGLVTGGALFGDLLGGGVTGCAVGDTGSSNDLCHADPPLMDGHCWHNTPKTFAAAFGSRPQMLPPAPDALYS